MFIIIETVKENEKTKYVSPTDEEGFLLSFVTEDQAIDYVEDLKDEQGEIDYQVVEVA